MHSYYSIQISNKTSGFSRKLQHLSTSHQSSWPPIAPVYIPNCTERERFSPITVAKRQVPWTPALTPNQAEIKFKKASVFHWICMKFQELKKCPVFFRCWGEMEGRIISQHVRRYMEGSHQKRGNIPKCSQMQFVPPRFIYSIIFGALFSSAIHELRHDLPRALRFLWSWDSWVFILLDAILHLLEMRLKVKTHQNSTQVVGLQYQLPWDFWISMGKLNYFDNNCSMLTFIVTFEPLQLNT